MQQLQQELEKYRLVQGQVQQLLQHQVQLDDASPGWCDVPRTIWQLFYGDPMQLSRQGTVQAIMAWLRPTTAALERVLWLLQNGLLLGDPFQLRAKVQQRGFQQLNPWLQLAVGLAVPEVNNLRMQQRSRGWQNPLTSGSQGSHHRCSPTWKS